MATHALCVLHGVRENAGMKYDKAIVLATGSDEEMNVMMNEVAEGKKFRNRLSKNRKHLRIYWLGPDDKPIESGGVHYNLGTTEWYRAKYG